MRLFLSLSLSLRFACYDIPLVVVSSYDTTSYDSTMNRYHPVVSDGGLAGGRRARRSFVRHTQGSKYKVFTV